MNHEAVSLRRRHLMLAGLAGAAAPAIALAAGRGVLTGDASPFSSGSDEQKMVVSGRIVRADGSPVAGATIEVRASGLSGEVIRAQTDGDGRVVFSTRSSLESTGRPRPIACRITQRGHEELVARLDFAGAGGMAGDRITQFPRDSTGVLRTSFGLTLA